MKRVVGALDRETALDERIRVDGVREMKRVVGDERLLERRLDRLEARADRCLVDAADGDRLDVTLVLAVQLLQFADISLLNLRAHRLVELCDRNFGRADDRDFHVLDERLERDFGRQRRLHREQAVRVAARVRVVFGTHRRRRLVDVVDAKTLSSLRRVVVVVVVVVLQHVRAHTLALRQGNHRVVHVLLIDTSQGDSACYARAREESRPALYVRHFELAQFARACQTSLARAGVPRRTFDLCTLSYGANL